jgi:hypothetical protein
VNTSIDCWDEFAPYLCLLDYALLAARRAQVLGPLEPLALDQPQAKSLKVARREPVEGQGVGCAGDRGPGLVHNLGSCVILVRAVSP